MRDFINQPLSGASSLILIAVLGTVIFTKSARCSLILWRTFKLWSGD